MEKTHKYTTTEEMEQSDEEAETQETKITPRYANRPPPRPSPGQSGSVFRCPSPDKMAVSGDEPILIIRIIEVKMNKIQQRGPTRPLGAPDVLRHTMLDLNHIEALDV